MGLADRHPDLGFGKLFKIIRRHGHPWNHKRVYRIYCAMKLNKRRRGKKRLPNRHPLPLAVSAVMNGCWSIDFTSDALWCGRRFRTFNVLDDFNREALAIEVDLNLPAERVIRTLERIAAWRGYPFIQASYHGVQPGPRVHGHIMPLRNYCPKKGEHYSGRMPGENASVHINMFQYGLV